MIQAARFCDDFRQEHLTAVKRIFRYLKGTASFGITYTRSTDFVVQGYSDADFGGDLDTRRSTTGYIFQVCGGCLSWRSKLQRIVALSSCESELIALTEAMKEALWFRKILADLCFDTSDPLKLHEDNQAAISVSSANSRKLSSRTKHFETRYFAIRHHIEANAICVEYCPTTEMIADMLTKPLGAVLFRRLLTMMGIRSVL